MSCEIVQLAVLGMALSVLSCDASLDESLANHSCSSKKECLPGWVCSRELVCVRREQAVSSGRGGKSGSTANGESREDADTLPDSAVIERDGAAPADARLPDGAVLLGDGGVRLQDGAVIDPRSSHGMTPNADGTCNAGAQLCDGVCSEVAIDPLNCGACGNLCADPLHGKALCLEGVCQIACEDTYDACDKSCVRLSENSTHCGNCNNSCPTPVGGTGVCNDGTCNVICTSGLTTCGDTCVALMVDATNCGACGRACLPDERCGDGQCVRMCVAPAMECDRSCVDLQSDRGHCGACGNACPGAQNQVGACVAAQCGLACLPGLESCDGTCVDLQNDPGHCGTCGNVCPEPPRALPYCEAGTCAIQCETGYEACDGQCVGQGIVETARQAGLGELNVCAALAALQSTLCFRSPDARYCDGACANVASDEANCGYCGRACMPGQNCLAGLCFDGE